LGKISIQAVLEDFKRIPLADLNLSTAEESNQDLAEVQAEFHNTREELERLQSQFDEVLAELEETHLQLHQIKQTQSEKAISTNLEEKMNPRNTSANPKLAHHLINNKLLLSVSPRAGHRTLISLIEILTKDQNITYERIRDLGKIYSLDNVKKIKFVRNPYDRAVSSYTVCCGNPTLKLWHGIGLTEKKAKELTFEQFIEIIQKKDVSKLNHHLSNQVEVGEGEKIKYDEIRKIENIEQEIQEILQKEGIDVDLAGFNKSGVRRKKQVKAKCYSKPFKELQRESGNAGNTWPDYEFFYNEQLTETVAKIYETDLYDYPPVEDIEEQQQLETQEEPKTDKVLLCAIAKNEAAYLVEWIAYHKFIVGFDEVLIYENDSTDNSRLILEKLDKLGICQYKPWPRSQGVVPQRSAYNDAIQTYNQSYQWVCFLDLDEFLVLKSFNTIQDCIQSFDGKADSIVINWLMFGSSGHSTYSPEPVIQRFTKCADYSSPIHKHMKSISKIDSIEFLDIHIPRLKPNSKYFHIDGKELHFGADPTGEHIKNQGYVNHKPARINHYQSKSLEEYQCRKLKGRATVDERSPQSHLKPGDFDRMNSYCNQIENLDILATISTLNDKIDFIYQSLEEKEVYPEQFKTFIQSEAARYDSLVKNSTPINKATMPKISKIPLWAPEAVGKISEFLMGRPKAKILEFGSGGSTIWLSSYDVDLISIEHDQTWFSALQSKLEEQKISNVSLLYREKPYFKIADEFPDHHFDLILVDGRDRNECIQASLKKVKNGGLLVLDDAQRTRYRVGRNLLEAFPSVRYHHPHRYTQIWFIRHDLNCRTLAVDNPFEGKIERVASEQSVSSDWERIFKQNPIRLYAGSLSKQAKKDGWIGLAFHKSDQWHIKHDLTTPFPIGDGIIDCFQAEDVLEHIEPADLLAVTFPEIYRVMKPGGFIRISLPDYRCDYLIDRCWKNEKGEIYYDPLGGGKWDAKLKRVTPGGHVWFPTYERLRSLIELSPLRHCKADWLHYYDTTGEAVIKEIDYSKGYVMRTPDHDRRVQEPRRPLSIVVDLYKD
jgi:predicted O-methyltransferase YrrM